MKYHIILNRLTLRQYPEEFLRNYSRESIKCAFVNGQHESCLNKDSLFNFSNVLANNKVIIEYNFLVITSLPSKTLFPLVSRIQNPLT